jgi:NHL repeat
MEEISMASRGVISLMLTPVANPRRVLLLVVFAGLCAAAPAGAATNTISTVAGRGSFGFSGDGGPATAAELAGPIGVAATPDGGVLIADKDNERVRRVSSAGTITRVAGNGIEGFSGDGGPATDAKLSSPTGVAATPDGGLLIADFGNSRVRYVTPAGTITTIAGNGTPGFSGDGGPATAAQLSYPFGLAVTADGGVLIADYGNSRVRYVTPAGTITTVAGNGSQGFSGDGGPATDAELKGPTGVAATPDGSVLIADQYNQRVRRVSPDGTITTVAGNGIEGFSGDGGPATAAQLSYPYGVAVTADGGVLIADYANYRVRYVTPAGTITTVAGNGTQGFSVTAVPPGTHNSMRRPALR